MRLKDENLNIMFLKSNIKWNQEAKNKFPFIILYYHKNKKIDTEVNLT
jgi:hypothetical protein